MQKLLIGGMLGTKQGEYFLGGNLRQGFAFYLKISRKGNYF